MTTDFEMAAINAIKVNFPLAEIHLCFFHNGQSVYRHVQWVGLQSQYQNDPDFALQIRMLLALAFLPAHKTAAAFDQLLNTEFYSDETESEHKEAIQALLAYVQNTYVYRTARRTGNRSEPLFPPKLWNVYDITGNFCVYFVITLKTFRLKRHNFEILLYLSSIKFNIIDIS